MKFTGPTTPPGTPGSLTGAHNGLEIDPNDPLQIIWGQPLLDPAGNAQLTIETEIPLNGNRVHFTQVSIDPNARVIIGPSQIEIVGDVVLAPMLPPFIRLLQLDNLAEIKRFRNPTNDAWLDATIPAGTFNTIEVAYRDDGSIFATVPDGASFRVLDLALPNIWTDINACNITLQGDFANTNNPSLLLKDVTDPTAMLLSVSNTGIGVISSDLLNLTNKIFVGDGSTTATAILQLLAGSGNADEGPLKFTAGTNVGTPEAGLMEFDGTDLFFTKLATREMIIMGVAGSSPALTPVVLLPTDFYGNTFSAYLGDPDGWLDITINGNAAKIPIYSA